MITSMYGLELAPPFFKIMPRRLLASLTEAAMKSEEKKAAPDAITMRKLAPTIHYEGVLIAEMAGTVRGRSLELAVVLDDPDNKENEASQNGDHPGKQGDDAHLNLISDALELSSRTPQGARTGN
jgi:hypothetical protein